MTAVDTAAGDPRCGSRWGVIHTHPQAERWAAQNLRRQGFQAYLPTHTVLRRDPVLRTLTRPVEAPLFTSYLFVGIQSPHWAPIAHTLGVKRLLMSGERPSIVAGGVVEALEASRALRQSIQAPGASWASGMPCSPVAGTPFAGHPAVVISVERQTARVAMLLFGELRTVTIDVACLVARDE